MNQRRLLVFALGAGVAAHAILLRAQPSSEGMRRVGVLAPSTRAKEEITLKPFFDQMRQLGWVEGQNIAYDCVYADDQQQTLPRLAAELVARNPEVIYAPPSVAAVAAKLALGLAGQGRPGAGSDRLQRLLRRLRGPHAGVDARGPDQVGA